MINPVYPARAVLVARTGRSRNCSSRDLAHAEIPLTAEQRQDVKNWLKRLRSEKRAIGNLSLGSKVIQRRLSLLQGLMDECLTQPPLCFQPEVCTFFSKETPDQTDLHGFKDQVVEGGGGGGGGMEGDAAEDEEGGGGKAKRKSRRGFF